MIFHAPVFQEIIEKLQRIDECFEDGEGTDVDRSWMDTLTFLGLLNRFQRSPAMWEITPAGHKLIEDAATAKATTP